MQQLFDFFAIQALFCQAATYKLQPVNPFLKRIRNTVVCLPPVAGTRLRTDSGSHFSVFEFKFLFLTVFFVLFSSEFSCFRIQCLARILKQVSSNIKIESKIDSMKVERRKEAFEVRKS